MTATDSMIARLQSELEERQTLVDQLVNEAEEGNRDLDSKDMEMITRARQRMVDIGLQLDPLKDAARIAMESRQRTAEIQKQVGAYRNPDSLQPVEYRTAGEYVVDRYMAQMGDDQSLQRLEMFHRVAAHQTTADNPGLLPESIVGPIVNFVDESRPIVSVVGPTDLGTGSWAYARVTQHTQVGLQAGEKTELASRKMTITKTAITAPTYGGYVNVSRQDISRTSPQILDMVIQDLAGQYAIQTEAAAATAMVTAAQVGPIIPASPTGANIATAVFAAAGTVAGVTKGQGQTVVAVSPDQLGIIGPVFPPVNPTNAYSTGFSAGNISSGQVGSLFGLPMFLSAGLPTDCILVFSTAAVRMFEARYGALQVVEPSVWGVQVGYAGDFQTVVVEPTAIVRVTTA